jgi:hypothetical protein
MPTSFQSAQTALDLVGVFVFALSGGLVAVKKRFDLFGVIVLALAAALGGGIVRDLLIGSVPPVGISDWRLITAATLGGLATFFFQPGIERVSRLVRILDAGGLAAFAVSGSRGPRLRGAPRRRLLRPQRAHPTALLIRPVTGTGPCDPTLRPTTSQAETRRDKPER